jgi:hypothetical protein
MRDGRLDGAILRLDVRDVLWRGVEFFAHGKGWLVRRSRCQALPGGATRNLAALRIFVIAPWAGPFPGR